MRDYFPKGNVEFKLPKSVYYQSLYAVRDYNRLKSIYKELLKESSASDGQPHGTTPGRPTEQLAIRLIEVSDKIDDIEIALSQIPEEYRKGVMQNILYGCGYPYTASVATWSRWRRKFLYALAVRKKII